MPHLPSSTDLPSSDFFVCLFSLKRKVLKGKCFADVEEVKQKMAETLKDIKINKFKNYWAVEKCLNGCSASNEEYLEGDWSLNIRINIHVFNKLILFWGALPSYAIHIINLQRLCNVVNKCFNVQKARVSSITLTGMAQFIGCHPSKQKVAHLIPNQHTWIGLQVQSMVRVHMTGNQSMFLFHIDVSLPLFLPPFPSH